MKTKKVILLVLLLFILTLICFTILLWKTNSFFVEKINKDFSRERVRIFTLKEGEKFMPIGISAKWLACKPGLNTVPDISYSSQGLNGMGCGFATWRSDESFVCVKCGNLFCGEGEDKCNCPRDCK